MKVGIVSSGQLQKFGRWDAAFHLLAAEHAELYEELAAKLTREEIIQLAKDLPFDKRAAKAVWPSMSGGTFGGDRGRAYFEKLLDSILKDKSPIPRKHRDRDVAVYCCAAAQQASSKILEEVLELGKQKKEKLLQLSGLLKRLKDKGCDNLATAMKKGPAKN